MTSEELVQAIIESGGPWSCPGWETCEKVPDCAACAEKQLVEYEKQIRSDAIYNFQEWLKTQIVGIDNKSKEILVVKGDIWELAISVYKEVL